MVSEKGYHYIWPRCHFWFKVPSKQHSFKKKLLFRISDDPEHNHLFYTNNLHLTELSQTHSVLNNQ